MEQATNSSNFAALDPEVLEQARVSRDRRFDGRFYVAVLTTGIYCRPICPARMPRRENVRLFASAAGAAAAGYRPCRRCRPEYAPGTDAPSTELVGRAMARIESGWLDHESPSELAGHFGISRRHLDRLFQEVVGATPNDVARTRRLHAARRLLDVDGLTLSEIALAAGFPSYRTFDRELRQVYGLSPGQLRKDPRPQARSAVNKLQIRLTQPYDWVHWLGFMRSRSIEGIEQVDGDSYQRTTEQGFLKINRINMTVVSVEFTNHEGALAEDYQQVKKLLDADAPVATIEARLVDAGLGIVARQPGLRVPGCWDRFELAVRAIVGQQVSVAGARTVLGRIVRRFGTERSDGKYNFPSPEQLAQAETIDLNMPRSRANSLIALSRQVAEGDLDLSGDIEAVKQQLLDLPGIGPWTVGYIAMRALGDPDAMPHNDLALVNAWKTLSDQPLMEAAKQWQPWRAYAAMHLWSHQS